jgi:hypothetical protein
MRRKTWDLAVAIACAMMLLASAAGLALHYLGGFDRSILQAAFLAAGAAGVLAVAYAAFRLAAALAASRLRDNVSRLSRQEAVERFSKEMAPIDDFVGHIAWLVFVGPPFILLFEWVAPSSPPARDNAFYFFFFTQIGGAAVLGLYFAVRFLAAAAVAALAVVRNRVRRVGAP